MSKKLLVRNRNHRMHVINPVFDVVPHPTKQEFRDEVNINSIMRKAKNGYPPTWLTSKTPRYGDFSSLPKDFAEAYSFMENATEAFYALPVEFRKELGHDPRNLPTAPKELFERFGLTTRAEAPGSGSAAPGAQTHPEGSGDRDLPSKAPTGANKGADKAPLDPPKGG